jgi:ribonuclease HI/ADP-ribose pyrophosphatase YjhB (NUDIX family)
VKQRISVRAVIRDNDKVLLLKRSSGRASILGKYELPGGRVEYGEQPEDTLRRSLHGGAGLHVQTLQLYDAVTYIDRDDRDIQYIVLVYLVALAPGHHGITLGEGYGRYDWTRPSMIRQDDITDLTSLLLGILQQQSVAGGEVAQSERPIGRAEVVVYSDGGSRGNPGPSAAGFVILNTDQEVIEQGGEYIGITTNSQAEYHGVRIGLERARELGYTRLDFRVDSMLVVNQMNGVYKVKNRELWPIYERIKRIVSEFEWVRFSHVRREFNRLADGMVNKTLDAHQDSVGRESRAPIDEAGV